MEFGLNFEKLLLIGLVAVLLIGPERLPKYAENVAKLARRAGEMLRDTRSRVRDEMGPEIDDVDWRKLDPRQYDPRRIIRDALFEDDVKPVSQPQPIAEPAVAPAVPSVRRTAFSQASPPPFDEEAT